MNIKKLKIGNSIIIKASVSANNEPINFVNIRLKNGKILKMQFLTKLGDEYFVFKSPTPKKET